MNIDPIELLSGESEAGNLPRDLHSVAPDFEINKLWELGVLHEPVLDQQYQEKYANLPRWPEQKNFAICLTHDVDLVSSFNPRQAARRTSQATRTFLGQPSKRHLSHIVNGVFSGAKGLLSFKDPITQFEKWVEVEKEVGASSTFFFTPEYSLKSHPSDCHYRYSDEIRFDGQACSVGEMIRELDRLGWEIGLHPSWWSYNNLDIMARQKDQLEQALQKEVISVRQHFLHFDIRETPLIQEQAGFKFDSSLGFNNEVGFRFGTSYPWKVSAGSREASTQILEIPLIVQDMAMLNPKKGLLWNPGKAFTETMAIAQKVKDVGGVLTLLWHPDTLDRPHVFQVYQHLLRELKMLNPWFANVRQIGEWWMNQSSVDLRQQQH